MHLNGGNFFSLSQSYTCKYLDDLVWCINQHLSDCGHVIEDVLKDEKLKHNGKGLKVEDCHVYKSYFG